MNTHLMAHSILIFLLLHGLRPLPSLAAQQYSSKVRDPSISRRCDALLEKLDRKRFHKRKIQELIVRNKRLRRVTPKNKKQVLSRLEINFKKLEREQSLSLIKIQKQEENLIRRGCPGVSL